MRESQGECEQVTRQRDEATAKLRRAEEQREAAERSRDQFLQKVWPKKFFEGANAARREAIIARLEETDSVAPLLFAALYKYHVLNARGTGDDLTEALQDVGEKAYQFWSEMGQNEREKAVSAEAWAEALQDELNGPYSIRVIRAGESKNQQWMRFKPDNSPVTEVHGWCIQNEQGRAVQKAKVS